MKLKANGLKMPRFSKTLWVSKKEECIEGNVRHNIYKVSASDLPFIMNQMKAGIWFYNKYLIEYDHVLYSIITDEE